MALREASSQHPITNKTIRAASLIRLGQFHSFREPGGADAGPPHHQRRLTLIMKQAWP